MAIEAVFETDAGDRVLMGVGKGELHVIAHEIDDGMYVNQKFIGEELHLDVKGCDVQDLKTGDRGDLVVYYSSSHAPRAFPKCILLINHQPLDPDSEAPASLTFRRYY